MGLPSARAWILPSLMLDQCAFLSGPRFVLQPPYIACPCSADRVKRSNSYCCTSSRAFCCTRRSKDPDDPFRAYRQSESDQQRKTQLAALIMYGGGLIDDDWYVHVGCRGLEALRGFGEIDLDPARADWTEAERI